MRRGSSSAAPASTSWRPRGMSRDHDPHEGIVWERGAGSFLWDVSGRRFLDCISGYSANNFGHAHPELVRAMQEQASKGAHFPGAESCIRRELEQDFASLLSDEVRQTLDREALREFGPLPASPDYAIWLSTTGARAIEVAWKIAYACRPGVAVCFDLGYHGRSLASSLLSDTARSGVVGSDAGLGNANIVRTIPFPREGGHVSMDEACESTLKEFQRMLDRDSASLSMLILEPAIGARGYYFAPDEFYQRLVRMARAAGVLVVSDEIQMGLGRLAGLSGALMAGWLPDIFVFGKSLGGGLMPVSAVAGERSIMNRLGAGLESETFAAQPLACAVARRALALLQSGELVERSHELHVQLRTELSKVMPASCVVGCGSATAIDFAVAVGSQYARELAWRWVVAARELGILLHLTGPMRDRVAIIPPLVIQPWEMNEVRAALVQAWEVVQRGVRD